MQHYIQRGIFHTDREFTALELAQESSRVDHYIILAILVQERLLKIKLAQGRASKVMVRMGTLFGERR